MPYHYPSAATPPSHPSPRLLCIYLIRFLVRVLLRMLLLLLLCEEDVPFKERESWMALARRNLIVVIYYVVVVIIICGR